MTKKTLILGDGLLGTELHRQSGFDVMSKKRHGFDITSKDTFHKLLECEFGSIIYCNYDTIINTIACTDTYSSDRDIHWNVNYKGVSYLVDFCNKWKIKLVHIVSDYIYANSITKTSEEDIPVHCNTWYGYTKLLGDAHVQLACDNYLLLRATHKPTPFPYDDAWTDQIGNFDYVDVIANKILHTIALGATGIYNIGTETKSMYELACKTNIHVNKANVPIDTSIPKDVTMNLTKLNTLYEKCDTIS
jgi:dTDP-4-dehydrorhamnose reductase